MDALHDHDARQGTIEMEGGHTGRSSNRQQAKIPPLPEKDVHNLPGISPESFPHVSGQMKPLNTIPNVRHLLRHYGFVVRYDVIRKCMTIQHPGQEGTQDNQNAAAVNNVLSLCALNRLPKTDVPQFLLNIADANPLNPVLDWITSRPWDGKPRFADLAKTLRTRKDFDRDLLDLLLRRWLISAVAAAKMSAGFRSRGVLVLQGPQSIGKTAWFMRLVPENMRDLLKVDAVIDPANKDTIISAVSHWLVELGELDATFRKADVARLKGFLTADYDTFRRPYARADERYPRRTVFFASVNDGDFLIDGTGNTRWWTVPVDAVDYSHRIDMQQLWAEVLRLFDSGERWWLDAAEEEDLEEANEDHRRVDPIEEQILERYDPAGKREREMTASQVLMAIGYAEPKNAQAQKAAETLRRFFGEPTKTKHGRVYRMPPTR